MKKNFFLPILSILVLISCQPRALFETKSECLTFIKSQHRDTRNCPGLAEKSNAQWIKWVDDDEAEICNGTLKIDITNFSDEEIFYTLTYNYRIMDPWTDQFGIRYGRQHNYKVVKKWRISREGKEPEIHFVSGHVDESADRHGPYSRIDRSYDL